VSRASAARCAHRRIRDNALTTIAWRALPLKPRKCPGRPPVGGLGKPGTAGASMKRSGRPSTSTATCQATRQLWLAGFPVDALRPSPNDKHVASPSRLFAESIALGPDLGPNDVCGAAPGDRDRRANGPRPGRSAISRMVPILRVSGTASPAPQARADQQIESRTSSRPDAWGIAARCGCIQ